MITNIEDRILLIIEYAVIEAFIEPESIRIKKGVWLRLGEQTGVSNHKWKNLYGGNQKPTPELIEAIAALFPQYAFWLVTGITDASNGHYAPANVLSFPEKNATEENTYSERYFKTSIMLLRELFNQAKVDNLGIESQRLGKRLIERKTNFEKDTKGNDIDFFWGDALLSEHIPQTVENKTYSDLLNLCKEREEYRKKYLGQRDLFYKQ